MEKKNREEPNKQTKKLPTCGPDGSLHWMYNKPDGKVHEEDYLLGKAIDSNYDKDEILEQDVIPAVARRIAGSSMLTTSTDNQVDLVRKLREDPLIMVKERERAARAALLNNPIQRRRLTELLKKEQEQRQVNKLKKDKKSDLDSILAAKISALGGEKKLNLDALLASDDSDSDGKAKRKKKKKKQAKDKKKEKKSTKKKSRDRSQSVSDEVTDNSSFVKSKLILNKDHSKNKEYYDQTEKRGKHTPQKANSLEYRRCNDSRTYNEKKEEMEKKYNQTSHKEKSFESRTYYKDRRIYNEGKEEIEKKYKHTSQKERSYDSRTYNDRSDTNVSWKSNKRKLEQVETKHKVSRLSSEERSARLASMAAAGRERERERGERTRPAAPSPPPRAPRAPLPLPASLHARLHSSRHYHQRGDNHMNEHFARR